MLKAKNTLILLILLLITNYIYSQNSSSDSLAYEIAKSKFQIDTSLTGFKLSSIQENNFIYTPNGTIDLHNGNETSGFLVMTMPNITYSKGVEFIQYMESTTEQDGMKIINIERLDTVINGNKIFESTLELLDKFNKTQYIYLAFLKKKDSAIGFTGKDIDNRKYITQFKKTFRDIKF